MARKAVCIGINDYPGTGADLVGCANDASDWGAALQLRGFAVTSLVNGQASGRNIRTAIRQLMREAASQDYLVIHYSGHGSYVPDDNGDEPDGYDECICPYDIVERGPITDDELNELYALRPMNAKLVVISDCCHSGSIARYAGARSWPSAMRTTAPTPKSLVRFLPPQHFLADRRLDRARGKGVIRRARANPPNLGLLMAACQDAEKSREDWFAGRANGAFTYTALWALDRLPAAATFRDWFARIRKVLPNQNYPQTPNLFGNQTMKDAAILI